MSENKQEGTVKRKGGNENAAKEALRLELGSKLGSAIKSTSTYIWSLLVGVLSICVAFAVACASYWDSVASNLNKGLVELSSSATSSSSGGVAAAAIVLLSIVSGISIIVSFVASVMAAIKLGKLRETFSFYANRNGKTIVALEEIADRANKMRICLFASLVLGILGWAVASKLLFSIMVNLAIAVVFFLIISAGNNKLKEFKKAKDL